MNDLDPPRTAFAQAGDLIVGQGRVSAVDMPNDVRIRFQHRIRINQARTGYGRSARMDRALNAVLARPFHHLSCRLTGLHGAQTDLTQQLDAAVRQFLEVTLDHALFEHRRTGQHFDARRAEIFVPALRGDRHRLQPDDIFGPARRMNFTRRNHRRHTPVEARVDPVQLLLARRVVPDDRMNVAVNQTRAQGYALGIHHCCCVIRIQIGFPADRSNPVTITDNTISVDQRLFQLA